MKIVFGLFALFFLIVTGASAQLSYGVFGTMELVPWDTVDNVAIKRSPFSVANEFDIMSVSGLGKFNAVIQRSTNGGRTWTTVYIDKGRMRYINNIAHPSPMTAIAVGDSGMILRTSDGGKTWDEKFSGAFTPLRHVAMYDSLHGVIGHVFDSTFLLTSDGGETWQPAMIPSGILPPIFGVVTLRYPFKDFIVAHLKWQNDNWFISSEDAGKTWAIKKSEIEVNNSFTAFSKDILYAGGTERVDPNSTNDAYKTQILKSTDRGKTWQMLLNTIIKENSTIGQVSFLDSLNGVGGNVYLWFTTDGGKSWIQDTSAKTTFAGIKGAVAFASPTWLTPNKLIGSCPAGTILVTKSPSSIEDYPELHNNITIGPNPVRDLIHIANTENKFSSVELYNALGEKILSQKILATEEDINVGNLPDGAYYLKFIGDKLTSTRKIVLAH